MSRDHSGAATTTRRAFCVEACKGASLMLGGLVLHGCGGSPTSPSSGAPALASVAATVSGRTITVPIDAASPLATVGGAAHVSTTLGRFLLARTGEDSVSALTATCTHEGCDITGFASQRFVCPCHGSQFTPSGTVVNGPATTALRAYATTFASGTVTFQV